MRGRADKAPSDCRGMPFGRGRKPANSCRHRSALRRPGCRASSIQSPGDQLLKQCAVEAARGPVIDVLDDGLVTQPGIAQPGGQALVVAMGDLTIDQQAEPFGMGKGRPLAGGFEFGEGLGHAGKPELVQLIKHWVGQQCPFSLTG